MASQLKVDTLTGVTTAGSIVVTGEGNSTTTNLQQGLCKHWGRYDQTTTTLNSSFNTSSVEDTSTGKLTVNISNSFSSTTTYSTSGSKGSTTYNFTISPLSASQYNVYQRQDGGTYADSAVFSFQAVGDLA